MILIRFIRLQRDMYQKELVQLNLFINKYRSFKLFLKIEVVERQIMKERRFCLLNKST
jgi:hypothetical protein